MNNEIQGKSMSEWVKDFPVLDDLRHEKETTWFNSRLQSAQEGIAHVGLTIKDVDDAADRLKRFAPLIMDLFPSIKTSEGIIESPLVAVPDQSKALGERYGHSLPGQLWAKLDSELPISGSIKARGGIYEVLKHAEDLAIEAGLLEPGDDYRKLATPKMKKFFGQYKIAVGSTGNLGLSIGIMSAALGFDASVHMSADARQWKKDKLRANGVHVFEYQSDYSVAVASGRKEAEADQKAYFVDDENSSTLFLGYAVAGRRLAGQLQTYDVRVNADNPLFVYLPCGVGGSPGGVAFGLKTVFGDDVHCIFAEPTHCPSMFLGTYTGLHDKICVQDFGIDNVTAADGLACGRPSRFVGKAMEHLVDGFFTIDDDELFRIEANLHDKAGIDIEPSAAAGFVGPWRILAGNEYRQKMNLDDVSMAHATHIAWCTGGSMVPKDEMAGYISKGESLL
ncbi:D-serine dehydratase [Bifidobacterium actinocoloniiforme DSM 22766]|uniref:Probable D-serine dehydratase n=1 Tax=Bifidobacterium actinocoloniiforme DSM 22766 TaxID=1437605 RepID=A0A086Z2J2_9BIFI|nr:D-serine ammonia-lyase [Bifidobacterium actinocoloniiforme]AKV55727.1 D-serine dehydratase [Bifidobacterium actinocoloniiforme DSM 22766]KFI40742.1 D-serine dehydratase [Bifidobacterium actinocoloniiforme DSM 22766]